MADYYGGNPLAEIKTLRARIEVLERLLGTPAADFETPSMGMGATPEVALPAAADVPRLWLVERNSGDLYELVCVRDDGRARLFLRRAGRTRAE